MKFNILKTKSKIFITFYLFLLIFNPPIFKNISFTVLLVSLSGLYLLLNLRKTKIMIKKLMMNKFFLIFLFSFFYISFISFFNAFFNNENILSYLLNFINYIFYYGALISVIIFINLISNKSKLTFNDLVSCYIWAGVLQAIIAISSYIFPEIRDFFLQLIISNSSSIKIFKTIQTTKNIRNYGFASSLFDIFGYSTSILVILAFVKGLYKNIFYIFLSLPLFIVPFLNARTGIILTFFGTILALIIFFKPENIYDILKKILIFLISIFLFIIVFDFFKNVILSISDQQRIWIISGIKNTFSFLLGESTTGYYNALLNRFIFFPSFFKTIFGAGATPMILINRNTDLGYIQNIWRYGIIGSLIIYIINYKIFKLSYILSKNKMQKTIVIILGFFFFVYMIKLNSLGYSQASVITFPLLFKVINDSNTNEI